MAETGAQDRLAEIKDALEHHDKLEWEEVEWLIGEVERLRGLLKGLEWYGHGGNTLYCPWCDQHRDEGHTPDCRLAAELR